MNLIDLQRDNFKKILTKFSPVAQRTSDSESKNQWSILIYDDSTSLIVSSFKSSYFKENNVALHIHINEAKEKVNYIDAIYFIAPSTSSVNMLTDDLSRCYFSHNYIYFSSIVSKPVMDTLVENIIKIKRVGSIRSMSQTFMNILPITENISTFGIQSNVDPGNNLPLLESLLTLIGSLDTKPVICFDKNSNKSVNLFKDLKEAYQSGNYVSENTKLKSDYNTLIYLWESKSDVPSSLIFNFSYFSLITEVFKLFNTDSVFNEKIVEDNKYHLDLAGDMFWRDNCFLDLPEVMQNVHKEVTSWKQQYDELNLKSTKGDDSSEMTENFQNIISVLPKMNERNKINQVHLKICSFIMKEIEEKDLERYIVILNQIYKSKKVSKDQLIELLSVLENKKLEAEYKIKVLLLINLEVDLSKEEYLKIEKTIIEYSTLTKEQSLFIKNINSRKFNENSEKSTFFQKIKNVSGNVIKSFINNSLCTKLSSRLCNLFNKQIIDEIKFEFLKDKEPDLCLQDITKVIVISIDGHSIREMMEVKDLSTFLNKEVSYICSNICNSNPCSSFN